MNSNIKVIYDTLGTEALMLNGYPPVVKNTIKNFNDSIELNKYINQLDRENLDRSWKAFINHSNFMRHYIKNHGILDIVKPENIVNNGKIYLCPFEITTTLESIIERINITVNGVVYNYEFIDLIDHQVLEGLRQGYVKLLINTIHDPLEKKDVIWQIEQYLSQYGISGEQVIFVGGNKFNEYYDKYPDSRVQITKGYIILGDFEDKEQFFATKIGSLGYQSELVQETDLDYNIVRSKKFLCLNRNLHRPHRWVLAYFAKKYNLLENSIFSFVARHGIELKIIEGILLQYLGQRDDISTIASQLDLIIPLELDTHHLSTQEKQGFTLNNNRKVYYANTYINIVSETSFDQGSNSDPFITEKTFINPIFNLQPFICVGNPFTLQTLRDLGFKTFSPVINESYDKCLDYRQRYRLIEDEIVRINNMPVQELHDSYYKLADIVIHNKRHTKTFANYDPFADAFNDIRGWYEHKQ